jgi:hypothetical protein
MNILKGSCMCGSVKYEFTQNPKLSFLCQCRQCQKITGSGHSAEFVVPEECVSLSGELKSYEMKSDRGNKVSSQFCPTCGNPILKKSSGYQGLVFFHAATLERPELFKPEKVFWCSSGQPWDHVNPKLEMVQNT